MRQIIWCLTIMLLPIFGWTQTVPVSGSIVDAKTGKPLEGVKMVLDSTSGAYTDSLGLFSLETTPGVHGLEAAYIGYGTLSEEIEVSESGLSGLEWKLVEEGEDFDIVVISSSLYEKSIAEETVSMDVLDDEIIENNNSTELGEAVERSVGVQSQDGQITIRGGSNWAYGVGSRTAVMIDNLPFLSADLGDAQLKHAPMENIEQVEVIKGASSVVFGSSALNGVVNAVTGWPTQEKETQITLFSGVYDQPPRPELKWWDRTEHPHFNGLWFNHKQKFGNLDVVAGGNYYGHQSFLEKGDEMRFRFNFKTRWWSKKVSGLSYGVNGNVMRENWGRFYLGQDMMDNAYRLGDGSYDRYWRFTVDPHFVYRNDEKKAQHRMDTRLMQVTRLGTGSDPNATSLLAFGHYQYQRKFEQFVITGGIPFTYGTAVSNLYSGRRQMFSGAAYAQGEYKTEKLSLVAGVRYEFTSIDVAFSTGLPTLRGGLNYQAAKNTWIRTSIGQAYRLPTIGERFIEAGFDILTIFPNPDLQPEKGWSWEAGVKQGLKVGNWNGYADFAFFLNEYDNFVEYQLGIYPPEGETPSLDYLGLKPFNLERTRIAGWEGEIVGKGEIGPVQISTLMGYTYHYPGDLDSDTLQRDPFVYFGNMFRGAVSRVEDEVDANGNVVVENTASILAMRNRHLFKGDLEARYKAFALGGNYWFASGLEKTQLLFDLAAPGLSDFVAARENGDWVFSLRGAFYPKEDLRLSLIVKNLTNREYMIRPGRIEAPRNITFQMKYTF